MTKMSKKILKTYGQILRRSSLYTYNEDSDSHRTCPSFLYQNSKTSEIESKEEGLVFNPGARSTAPDYEREKEREVIRIASPD